MSEVVSAIKTVKGGNRFRKSRLIGKIDGNKLYSNSQLSFRCIAIDHQSFDDMGSPASYFFPYQQ